MRDGAYSGSRERRWKIQSGRGRHFLREYISCSYSLGGTKSYKTNKMYDYVYIVCKQTREVVYAGLIGLGYALLSIQIRI
jgi:hypothetical protein